MNVDTCYVGDVRDGLRAFIAGGIRAQTCITSPPYWGLRDYGHAGQIGLEPTPGEYVAQLVEVFRLVRDVLADDGTLWLNLGDSYGNPSAGRNDGDHRADGAPGGMSYKATGTVKHVANAVVPKNLVGIPWRVAFALQADGWFLRSDIIWHKPNPMPESVTDRPTKSHEYLFLLAKSERYFYDAAAIAEPATNAGRPAGYAGRAEAMGRAPSGNEKPGTEVNNGDTRNRRSVWTITTKPYAEAHFAVFPTALIEPCVMAGSRVGDVVLDPFLGSGTTAQVAQALGRRWIGCELNPEYVKLHTARIAQGSLVLA